MSSVWTPAPCAGPNRSFYGWRVPAFVACAALAAATASAQPPTPGFTARLLDINKRLDTAVKWTDAMLNSHGITYHDVQLDIIDTVDAVNFGRTTEVFNLDTEEFIRINGKFLEVPKDEERDWASNPDVPYPDGTFFPGGDGQDFAVLVEAEVTIPVGRWQIAFGSDAAGWIHLVDPRDGPPPTTEPPPPNPVGFHFRLNDNEALSAAHFGMYDSALWYNSPRPFGWSGVTIDTRNHDQPVTTRLRAFFMETDGPDGLELVIRDTDDGRVGLPEHIGPNNTLLPEQHDWRLLRDGEHGWEVNTVPAPTVGPLSSADSPLAFPVMNVSGQNLIGPAGFKGQLVDDLEDPDDLVLGTPQAVPGLVKLRRYFVPDFNEFDSVADAREFIQDLDEPDNEHKQPIAQGFVDRIAWQSGDFLPPALGFPFVRTDFGNSPNEYGVRIEGELLIPESLASLPPSERIIRFKDANDAFAGFVLDLDGDGNIDERDNMDNLLEVVIDDADPAFGLDGFGSPISEALIGGSLATQEDRWRKFEFYMSDSFGADSALLAWDQNVSSNPSVPVPAFPTDPDDPLSPEHVIGPENFRSFVTPILKGELIADVGAHANTLIFEVNVAEEQWDTIGIADSLTPDFVVANPNAFERVLEFGDAKIVIDIVEGTPMEGLAIDIVDETVDTIQIQGKDFIEWADEESDEWQNSFIFTYGSLDNWDVSEFLTRGIIRLGDPLVFPDGDYNGSGLVEQGDLDLVLGNWGADADDVPATWIHQPPMGIVDQAELDGVLGNWGGTAPGRATAAAVPEPSALVLTLLLASLLALRRWWRGCLGSTSGSPQRRPAVGRRGGIDCGLQLVSRADRPGAFSAACPTLLVVSLRNIPRRLGLIATAMLAGAIPMSAGAQTTATGFTGRLIDVTLDVNEHAEALAFLRGIGLNSSQVQSDVYDLVPFADFGGSHRGDFYADDGEEPLERGLPYPGGTFSPGEDGQDFVVSLEALVTIPPGTWQIAFGTGDGGAVQIDGVPFRNRYNDTDPMVRTFFDMTHDAVIFDNNRGLNEMGEDRGWTGGTFRVSGSEPLTTRLVHTFHQTPHRFENNHLSELIIRDADGGDVDIGAPFFDPTDDDWEVLAHSTHGWQVRPTFGGIPATADPLEVGPVDHIGGRSLLGSVLRPDTTLGWTVEDLPQRDRQEGMLLVRRYRHPTFDENFTPEDFDQIEEIEAWIQEQDDNGGPEHLGYINNINWASGVHYPEGLGFDNPFGDADNYVVKVTGQLDIPRHDLDEEGEKIVSFKDGTADFSGLIMDLGDVDDVTIIEDTIPTSLDGTDNGGSDIVRVQFDFSAIGPDAGWVDFTYYMVGGEGDDNALLAWDQNPLVPAAPPFPATPSSPIRPEHVIRPESFRLTEEIIPDLTIEADLAVFRDEDEDSTRMPMVVFEVDPLTGQSDTLGIEKIDPQQPVPEGEERIGILDVSGVHILLDYITAEPEPGFTVDLLEGSVDQVVGTPTFHFRVPDPFSPLNNPAVWSQAWDTSQFTTTGKISFLGLAGNTAGVPEPSSLALATVFLLVGAVVGRWGIKPLRVSEGAPSSK